MVILDLEVLDINLKKIIENIKHQKEAQRNSVQKYVLNSSPSFFSASLVKKTLPIITSQNRDFARWGARKAKRKLNQKHRGPKEVQCNSSLPIGQETNRNELNRCSGNLEKLQFNLNLNFRPPRTTMAGGTLSLRTIGHT